MFYSLLELVFGNLAVVLDLFPEVCLELQKLGSFVCLHWRHVFCYSGQEHSSTSFSDFVPLQFVFAQEFGGDRSSRGSAKSHLYLAPADISSFSLGDDDAS